MVSHAMKRKAERRLRRLLAEDGFAQPDEVEYGPTSVTLIWHSVRKSIIVDVTENGEVGQSRAGPTPEPRQPAQSKSGRSAEKARPARLRVAGRNSKPIPPVPTLKEKIQAEQTARAMLEERELPQPDEVEYGYHCIRFIWNDQKVVLVIDINEPPDWPEATDGQVTDLEEDAA